LFTTIGRWGPAKLATILQQILPTSDVGRIRNKPLILNNGDSHLGKVKRPNNDNKMAEYMNPVSVDQNQDLDTREIGWSSLRGRTCP
jgi:hypothetical protein